MANLILILGCLVIGAILRRILPDNTPKVLGGVVLRVALPAVTLLAIHDLPIPAEGLASLAVPATMAWWAFGLTAVFIAVLARPLGWSRGTRGALMLTAGLANTSFVGFPLLSALYGERYGNAALSVGIIVDQLGSFLVVSTLGVWVAATHGGRAGDRARDGARDRVAARDGARDRVAARDGANDRAADGTSDRAGPKSMGPTPRDVLVRLLTFPPFVAMLIALATRGWAYPAALRQPCEKLGALMIPLALLQVGFQLRLDRAALARHWRNLALGLFVRLVVAPAAFTVAIVGLTHSRGLVAMVTILEAAMAPMITGGILAVDHDLDPELANLMLAVGIPLSLVTVPAWWFLLRPVLGGP